jgi:hypothetical protein
MRSAVTNKKWDNTLVIPSAILALMSVSRMAMKATPKDVASTSRLNTCTWNDGNDTKSRVSVGYSASKVNISTPNSNVTLTIDTKQYTPVIWAFDMRYPISMPIAAIMIAHGIFFHFLFNILRNAFYLLEISKKFQRSLPSEKEEAHKIDDEP